MGDGLFGMGQKVACFWKQYYECSHILNIKQFLHPRFTETMGCQTRSRNTGEKTESKLEFRIKPGCLSIKKKFMSMLVQNLTKYMIGEGLIDGCPMNSTI